MYQICKRCIMDNASDETIRFDENGYCNYCNTAYSQINTTVYFPNETGAKKLKEMLAEIKEHGKNKSYDCLMGISGGLDSCYLAYLGYKWGLRILAVHIDDGFDTEICKSNIKKLIAATGIKLLTIKPDAVQFNDLSKAYLKAGVPNIAVPQDNVLFAFLYDCARKYKLKYFLSGGNFALECILQRGNTHDAYDMVNLKDIHKKFGTEKINKLKFISVNERGIDLYLRKIKTMRPLDYIEYNRDRAFQELKDFCGFEYYGRKHLENIFTAFAQLYWFPKKFGVDKRRSHLSSMIVSGQLSRKDALKMMEEPMYDENMMAEYIRIIKDRLKISDEEFSAIMSAEPHAHSDYKVGKYRIISFLKKLKKFFKG